MAPHRQSVMRATTPFTLGAALSNKTQTRLFTIAATRYAWMTVLTLAPLWWAVLAMSYVMNLHFFDAKNPTWQHCAGWLLFFALPAGVLLHRTFKSWSEMEKDTGGLVRANSTKSAVLGTVLQSLTSASLAGTALVAMSPLYPEQAVSLSPSAWELAAGTWAITMLVLGTDWYLNRLLGKSPLTMVDEYEGKRLIDRKYMRTVP